MDVTWREELTGGHLGMLKTAGLDTLVTFMREKIREGHLISQQRKQAQVGISP